MDAISFLEICTIKNKLKNLLQAKYILVIAFVLFTFASDLFSNERITIENGDLLIAIYFILIIGLWLLGFAYFAFSKTFNIKNADKQFLLTSPIRVIDICNYEFRKKCVFLVCANVFSFAYFVLYFCMENTHELPLMISIAILSIIAEINVFSLLYSCLINKKSVKSLAKVISIICCVIFLSFIWCYLSKYDFATNKIERIIGLYKNSQVGCLIANISFCLFTFVLRACKKVFLGASETNPIINTQLDWETSSKEYKEKNVTSICKKIYVEMWRNKAFQIKQVVIAIFGIILAILCVGLCETFGDAYGTSIGCIFLLVYALLSGFIFGLDIFETEFKKHYIHLIPETPITKFVKISIPYLVNQFAIGLLMIGVIDFFNAYDINSALLAATYLSFLMLSLSSELIFFVIYKNENTSDNLLLFINGIIKIVVFTPSLMTVVSTFLFPINQYFSSAIITIINIVIVLMTIRVSHKVLR